MKITLTFDLPEEQDDLNVAQNGSKFKLVLEELSAELRKRLKCEEMSADTYEALETTRIKLYELMSDCGVSLD